MAYAGTLVLQFALAFTQGGRFAAVSRRSMLSTPAVLAMAPSPAAAGSEMAGKRFSHSLASVEVSGVSIPVAIWRPAAATAAATVLPPATYPYKIDIGKIAAKLRVGWLTWLPKFDFDLPCGAAAAEALPGFSRARDGDAIMFAHGFLGSVYDFAHAAEALASDGFTVVAPELPESLSASYLPPEGLDRATIIRATRELVAGSETRWGIFGHSAGAGSALLQPETYSLGRACFAGGAARFDGYTSSIDQPVFVCSSNGDGCNQFMQLPDPDLRNVLAADGDTVLFESLATAYPTPARPPARGAFVFAADNSAAPLPCHISFLWSEVNDAMISLLSSLLPLAKALGLFLLDFDVYRETRDAEATAALLVPALRRFFLSSSSAT